MRHLKLILILFLSVMVVFITGCQKDSVEPQKDTSTTQHEKVAPKPKPKQENKGEEAPKAEKPPTPSQTVEKTKTTPPSNVVTEKKSDTPTAPKQAAPKVVPVTASVQVIGYQGKSILATTNVPIKQGDTALLATQTILKAKGIPISVRGSGQAAYVEGIGNDFASDHGPMSGWLIYINGKKISNSSGSVTLHKGDKVLWKYTTDGNG